MIRHTITTLSHTLHRADPVAASASTANVILIMLAEEIHATHRAAARACAQGHEGRRQTSIKREQLADCP